MASIFSPRYKKRPVRKLRVLRGFRRAVLASDGWAVRCAIGRAGVTRRKIEGDGASPIGTFDILFWRLRAGNGAPRPLAAWRATRPCDGWCDDPARGAYNRAVSAPFAGSCEAMWRKDAKYDAVGVLNYNFHARARGRGSAIFFHICDDDYGATAGCVAIRAEDMRKLLPRLARKVRIAIG